MKLSDYIEKYLAELEKIDFKLMDVEFNLGVDPDMTVNPKSSNRIKFTVARNKE